jgi:chromate reductase, NAD(P)H dehydrogenase (quinone)
VIGAGVLRTSAAPRGSKLKSTSLGFASPAHHYRAINCNDPFPTLISCHENTSIKAASPDDIEITVFDGIGNLPVFSPDLEGLNLPESVQAFTRLIAQNDGLLIGSPEYIRGIPGGLKNAIDWLVSGDQIIGKPIALIHASHRGDDLLDALRKVLSTVSSNFNEHLFLRFSVMKETPEDILEILKRAENRQRAEAFLRDFASFWQNQQGSEQSSIAL